MKTLMKVMKHKGHTARIEYDERDNIFVGRVLGVRTTISFHGETVAEFNREFETAIDDYPLDCIEQSAEKLTAYDPAEDLNSSEAIEKFLNDALLTPFQKSVCSNKTPLYCIFIVIF